MRDLMQNLVDIASDGKKRCIPDFATAIGDDDVDIRAALLKLVETGQMLHHHKCPEYGYRSIFYAPPDRLKKPEPDFGQIHAIRLKHGREAAEAALGRQMFALARYDTLQRGEVQGKLPPEGNDLMQNSVPDHIAEMFEMGMKPLAVSKADGVEIPYGTIKSQYRRWKRAQALDAQDEA